MTSRGVTGPEPEVCGGARGYRGKKKTNPSVLERWLQRPGGPGEETQVAGKEQGGSGTRGENKGRTKKQKNFPYSQWHKRNLQMKVF